jgi:hypothetical protein
VHLHQAGKVGRFANDARGCAALIAWLGGFVIARVAFEPTGAYHRAFEPPKVALVAIMRKLLILANALLLDGRTWTPTPA